MRCTVGCQCLGVGKSKSRKSRETGKSRSRLTRPKDAQTQEAGDDTKARRGGRCLFRICTLFVRICLETKTTFVCILDFLSAMATYPFAIPSLLAQHPALAPLAVALPELNNSEAAGAPLRPAAVDEARLITTVLQAAHGLL
jgi:hypothetical protein